MIEYTDIEARKQVAAQVMASFLDMETPNPEPSAPTIVFGSEQRDCDRIKFTYSGWLSICKKAANRWFWYARAWSHKASADWEVYGIAETEQQATVQAHQTILEDFPTGFCFSWFEARIASEVYSEHLAKRAWFSQDWRKRFPLWAGRTHLYDYSSIRGKLPIVAVTAKSVFVYRPPFFVAEQVQAFDMQKVQKRHCIVFEREKLERDGYAYHRKVGHHLYVEPRQIAHHDHNHATSARIDDLRRVMQKEHPDRGGNVELFRAAQEEYQQLKQSTKRGAA